MVFNHDIKMILNTLHHDFYQSEMQRWQTITHTIYIIRNYNYIFK
jgi:hypothetical protein